MTWLDKIKSTASVIKKDSYDLELWSECPVCKNNIFNAELNKNLHVCTECDHHFRVSAKVRINQLLEEGSFIEHDTDLFSTDPIKFKDSKKYKERLRTYIKKGMTTDSVISGSGQIKNHKVEICVFEFSFMGGSMGVVVGEKITRAIERAIINQSSLVILSCSGGARMQEGILSLMQMAKTSAALSKLAEKRLPYFSILADPTTGGVSASFAMLGDIIIAEPGALIGFAGPRVIEQTIHQKLPEGFQRSEFLLEHGLIDQVVHRKKLKETLDQLLSLCNNSWQ